MKVSADDMTVTLSLQEMSDIIRGRKDAALMKTLMENGKENPLNVAFNEGVKMMAKYMGDYFMNEMDNALFGGEWKCR